MPYIGNQPGTGVRSRFIYTATASQTTFSGADDNGKTLKYADSDFVDVYLNGICLVPVTDYTSTSKTSVVLTQAASLNDTLEVIAYDIATIADTVSKADGGTFEATVTFADGADLLTASKGTDNVRIGENAGAAIASGGDNNVTIGKDAGAALTTGDNNVAIGHNALKTEDGHGSNTAIGYEALKTLNAGTNAENVAVGDFAGTALTDGVRNVFIGGDVASQATTPDDCVVIGWEAARNGVLTGHDSVMVGKRAGYSSTSGGGSVFVGQEAGHANLTSDFNTYVGYQAGHDATGDQNTYIGGKSGQLTIDGRQNVAVGYNCMANADAGDENTFVGVGAGFKSQGDSNTAVGRSAGEDLSTGDNNLLLGNQAGRTGSPGGKIDSENNEIVLGDGNITACNIQVDWTIASDERDKTDFSPLDLGLDFVKQLSPLTYKWDKRSKYIDEKDVTTYNEDGTIDHEGWEITTDLNSITPDGTHKEDWLDIGFKAQEVEALEQASGYKKENKTNLISSHSGDGKQMGLQYSKFVPVLVKAIQELSAKNDALETENTAIKARLDALEAG